MRDSIDNILKIIGSVLEHHNIQLKINAPKPLIIYGNKNEFSQVLMNLIINAKDAFGNKGVQNPLITICVYEYKQKIRIDIEDNAGGINNDIIENIFEPYFTTKDEKGTGIGLYLSKAIIEDKMQGQIDVYNGKNGAVFTIMV